MNGENWFNEMIVKRKAVSSCVTFLVTADEKRVGETIRKISNDEMMKESKTAETIIVYDCWKGIRKAVVNEKGSIIYQDLNADKNDDPLASMMKSQSTMQELDKMLKNAKSPCVVILTNVRLERPHQPTELDTVLESWCQDGDIYRAKSMVIVFTHDTGLFNQKTIDNSTVIGIPPSTKDERRDIIKIIRQAYIEKKDYMDNLADIDDKMIENLVNATAGLNKSQTDSAMLESLWRKKTFDMSIVSTLKMDLLNKKKTMTVKKVEHGFEIVGGYDYAKDYLIKRIINVIKDSVRAKKMGLKPPRGIMFYGMAGTGKTLISECISHMVNMPFVEMNYNRIKSGILGESERNLRDFFASVRAMSPCIVFIDEMDRFGSRDNRGGELDGGTSKEMFSEILSQLGDSTREFIVIGTTNKPQNIDPALRRVGRFDALVPIFLPDAEAREGILNVHTRIKAKVPLAKNVDLKKIAEQTAYWNGAEVEELVQRAVFVAFNEGSEEVSMAHFEKALENFIVNVEARKKETKEYLRIAREMTNDKNFLKMAEMSDAGTEEHEKGLD